MMSVPALVIHGLSLCATHGATASHSGSELLGPEGSEAAVGLPAGAAAGDHAELRQPEYANSKAEAGLWSADRWARASFLIPFILLSLRDCIHVR